NELKSVKAALKAIEETQTEDLATRVAETKADLEDQIAAASESGEHRRVAKLTTQLAELIAADKLKDRAPAADERPQTRQEPLRPEFVSWTARNSDWWEKDREKTAMAVSFAQAVRATTNL